MDLAPSLLAVVLAYHYLVLGHLDRAAAQLEKVTRLTPDDRLSLTLLKALRQSAGDRPAPQG